MSERVQWAERMERELGDADAPPPETRSEDTTVEDANGWTVTVASGYTFSINRDALKARIDRFREADPDFRVESEGYEMAAVADAPLIARGLATHEGWQLDGECAVVGLRDETAEQEAERRSVVEAAVERFRDLSPDEQRKLVPDLNPGHSGNTFDGATALAYRLLTGQEC